LSVRTRPSVARRIRPTDPATKRGRAPSQIGDHNLRVTLEAIRREGPLTRLELGSRTGLTGPGTTNILRRLGDDGLITARKRAERGGGQPSTEFAINPDGAFSVGIRLRNQDAEAVLLNLGGKVRARRSFEIALDRPAAIEEAVVSLTAPLRRSARMLGVGVAAENPSGVELGRLAAAGPSPKVLLERDCVTALLAERTFGVGLVDGGVMLIIIDERVRAGFLFRGAPFGGVHSKAGSVGLMRTGADHVPLDAVASMAVLREAMTPSERAKLAAGEGVPLSPPIRKWIRDAAGHLVDAIVASAGFLAPGAVLIGGDLPQNIVEELVAQISVERSNTAVRPVVTPWISPIRPTTFAGAGIAIGAALLPFFDQLLPQPTPSA
jgi:predicted NBD/HSP70 family sugar kinase